VLHERFSERQERTASEGGPYTKQWNSLIAGG
jgi:hypothetical protein